MTVRQYLSQFIINFKKGLLNLHKGLGELTKEYIVIDTISDSLFHLTLDLYFSFIIPHHNHAHCEKICGELSNNFCGSLHLNWEYKVSNNIVWLARYYGIQRKSISWLLIKLNYLGKLLRSMPILSRAYEVVHFHSSVKIFGLLASPLVYSVEKTFLKDSRENQYFSFIENSTIKLGKFIGVNPYEGLFVLDSLFYSNNTVAYGAKSFVTNDIDKRVNDHAYAEFMKISENWLEVFVDAYEHAREYYGMFANIFAEEINNPFSSNYKKVAVKAIASLPVVLLITMLDYISSKKEEYFESLYSLNQNSKDLAGEQNFSEEITSNSTIPNQEGLAGDCSLHEVFA